MEKLKPCPFCGNEVTINDMVGDYGSYIRCKNENCILNEIELDRVPEEAAVEAWNKRHDD